MSSRRSPRLARIVVASASKYCGSRKSGYGGTRQVRRQAGYRRSAIEMAARC